MDKQLTVTKTTLSSKLGVFLTFGYFKMKIAHPKKKILKEKRYK